MRKQEDRLYIENRIHKLKMSKKENMKIIKKLERRLRAIES